MHIRIKYHWVDIPVSVCCGGIYEPHYKLEYQDVDYEYDAYITEEDVVDYIVPGVLRENERAIYERAVRQAIEVLGIDYDALSDNEFFCEFIKDKYEEKAREEFDLRNDY